MRRLRVENDLLAWLKIDSRAEDSTLSYAMLFDEARSIFLLSFRGLFKSEFIWNG